MPAWVTSLTKASWPTPIPIPIPTHTYTHTSTHPHTHTPTFTHIYFKPRKVEPHPYDTPSLEDQARRSVGKGPKAPIFSSILSTADVDNIRISLKYSLWRPCWFDGLELSFHFLNDISVCIDNLFGIQKRNPRSNC